MPIPKSKKKLSKKVDEDGHIIVAENVKLIFGSTVQPMSSVKVEK